MPAGCTVIKVCHCLWLSTDADNAWSSPVLSPLSMELTGPKRWWFDVPLLSSMAHVGHQRHISSAVPSHTMTDQALTYSDTAFTLHSATDQASSLAMWQKEILHRKSCHYVGNLIKISILYYVNKDGSILMATVLQASTQLWCFVILLLFVFT